MAQTEYLHMIMNNEEGQRDSLSAPSLPLTVIWPVAVPDCRLGSLRELLRGSHCAGDALSLSLIIMTFYLASCCQTEGR